jgi:hypothetical protein
MDNQTLLYIMTAFVVIAGLSLFFQLVFIFGIYRSSKALQAKATELLPKVESLVDASHNAVVEGKQQILDITAKTNEILDSTKRQLAKVEDVVADASARAKVQLERAELVIDDTVTRAHEAVSSVHGGIMRPLREIHGVAAGIKAVVGHLASGRRSDVLRVTQDEEMFI